MKKYIAKRLLHSVFILWLVVSTIFVGLRLVPGGPARMILGEEATDEAVVELERELGLDQPLYVQYFDWMTDLLTLDFGTSYSSGQPAEVVVGQAIPMTFSIGVVAIITGLAIAIPAGIISATRKNEPLDYVATVAAFLGLSMPAFFIGIILAVVFGVWLNVLPIYGYTSLMDAGLFPWLERVLLPGIAVGLPYAAVIMRMMRSSLLEVLNEPYMQTARAKGISGRTRLFKHALQNALIPVITVAGIQFALILGGSVTVEIVFGIQGLGRVLVDSVLRRDYPIVQLVIIVISAVMILTNLIVDVVYTVVDPRIRYGGEQ